MSRILTGLVLIIVVAAAAILYAQKHDATLARERIADLRHDIAGLNAELDILRAEWTALDTPDRIQALADRFLVLQPAKPEQIVKIADLPIRPVFEPPLEAEAGDIPVAFGEDELTTGSIGDVAPSDGRNNEIDALLNTLTPNSGSAPLQPSGAAMPGAAQ
ncbi:MAG: hypothetical protein AAFX39_06900 [Pseudomonadota bacterium]